MSLNKAFLEKRDSGERTLPEDPHLYAFQRIYKWVSVQYGDISKTVLDYGCGSGYGAHILSDAFYKVYAVDVNSETIEVCRSTQKKDNLEFSVLLENGDIPFSMEFDRVFSFQVIEHIPLDQVNGYLKNVFKFLKPGGIAIITTPNSCNYHGGHSGFEFHVKEYTAAELQHLVVSSLPDCEFEIKGVWDVPSTRLRNYIKKKWKNTFFSRAIARVMSSLLSRIEMVLPASILEFGKPYICEVNVSDVNGSLMVVLKKPLQPLNMCADDVLN